MLPRRGVWYGSETGVQPRVAGRRARAVGALSGTAPVVVVEAAALLEGVVPVAAGAVELQAGGHTDFEALIRDLAGLGYVRVDQVEDAGDFSVRGGLIDVFPSTSTYPVRVEFWGDEIESLRNFSVYSQRSLGPLQSISIYAAAEEGGAHPVSVLSLLPHEARVVRVDPLAAAAQMEAFQSDRQDVLGEELEEGWYLERAQVDRLLAEHAPVVLDALKAGSGEKGLPVVRAGDGRYPWPTSPRPKRPYVGWRRTASGCS